ARERQRNGRAAADRLPGGPASGPLTRRARVLVSGGGETPMPDRPDATHLQLVLELLLESGADYTSGEALSGKLGLSRTAVWKMVNVLRDRGYGIEAVPSRGYRLVRVPDRLSALELSPLLETHDLGRTVHPFHSPPTTSHHAFRLP